MEIPRSEPGSSDLGEPRSDRRERSIERILARRRARERRRRHTRAPDWLHGNCRLDSIYETFGAEWVESTAFVQPIRDGRGFRVGWTVATFDERFLTLAHGLRSEIDDLRSWLEMELGERERIVLVDVGRGEGADVDLDVRTTIPVRTERARLLWLEREYLDATRDSDFGRAGPSEQGREQRLLESRVDVLSVICLCATLVAPSR